MKLLPLILFLSTSHICLSQNDFNALYAKAKAHYQNKEYAEFTDAIQKAVLVHPYHQGALYYSGVAAALNSKPEAAISFLKKAILIDSRYDLKNPDLNSLNDRRDFVNLLSLQEEMNTPVINSQPFLQIKDRQLHVEGIAFNPRDRSFYFGSIHKRKIVKVAAAGYTINFNETPDKEMLSVFGLKVDNGNRFLWACTSPIEEMEGYDSTFRSKVFKFSIPYGDAINSYEPPTDVRNSVFGDLAISRKNEIYVSDSKNNIVFKVNESTKKLEKFFESPEFANIQGICFSSDNSQMFIADYIKGIYKLNIRTKQLSKIASTLDLSLKGIDGLLYYRGNLIAIQNGVFPLRSVKLILNKDASTVVGFITIDRARTDFNEPTLGVIDGRTLYYIANSQWGGYDATHHIKPFDDLEDIVILKVNLDDLK
ncbi:hypothetical protein BH09BAC3_BH09BAC3_06050 [soil metagenome]